MYPLKPTSTTATFTPAPVTPAPWRAGAFVSATPSLTTPSGTGVAADVTPRTPGADATISRRSAGTNA